LTGCALRPWIRCASEPPAREDRARRRQAPDDRRFHPAVLVLDISQIFERGFFTESSKKRHIVPSFLCCSQSCQGRLESLQFTPALVFSWRMLSPEMVDSAGDAFVGRGVGRFMVRRFPVLYVGDATSAGMRRRRGSGHRCRRGGTCLHSAASFITSEASQMESHRVKPEDGIHSDRDRAERSSKRRKNLGDKFTRARSSHENAMNGPISNAKGSV
jgi:hypothetical protein